MTATIPAPDVVLEHAEHALLAADAAAWRLLQASPHVAEILAEWVEWTYRVTQRDISNAFSEGNDWQASDSYVTYAEVARRRATYTTPALTPAQIRQQATESWARVERWIENRTPPS